MLFKELKITNANGESIQFGRHFFLEEDFDLSGLKADVIYSEHNDDGASYQRTRLDIRDFSIKFFIKNDARSPEWFESKRREAYNVFNPKKNPMKLDFMTGEGKKYYINAELVASPTFATEEENSNGFWQDGLLQFSCNDPFVYDADETVVQIATWIPSLVFPLVITEDTGVRFGYRSPSLIANVYNSGHDNTGMIIKFRALGSLSNPSLVNVNTYEVFKLNMEMIGGDVVEVSTYKGKKYARLTRNNVTTSVFGKIDLSSTFLQLRTGDNLFRYDADSGLDNLEVSIYFRSKHIGV